MAGDGYQHLSEFERRFAEEFGEREYDIARDVLARIAELLDRWAAEEDAASGDSREGSGKLGTLVL